MENLLIKHRPSSSLVQLGKINFRFFKCKERSKRKADSLNRGRGGTLSSGSISLVDSKQPLSKWNKLKGLVFFCESGNKEPLKSKVCQMFSNYYFFSLETPDLRSIVLPYENVALCYI